MRGSLAIRSWYLLKERTAFNEVCARFRVSYDEGPTFTLMVAMAPNARILRAWQIRPGTEGSGGQAVSPECLPFHIRDLAQSAVEALPGRR